MMHLSFLTLTLLLTAAMLLGLAIGIWSLWYWLCIPGPTSKLPAWARSLLGAQHTLLRQTFSLVGAAAIGFDEANLSTAATGLRKLGTQLERSYDKLKEDIEHG